MAYREGFVRTGLGLALLAMVNCGGSAQEVLSQFGPERMPPPIATATSPAPPQASAKPAETVVPEPPPPPEAVPDKLGSPPSSLAKRPSFASSSSFAPQPRSSSALYEEAKDPSTANVAGFVCLVSVKPYQDNAPDGFPDLSVDVTVSRGKETWSLSARGGEDRVVMTFAVPLVELRAGDRIAVSIVDRDIVFNDFVEKLQTTFKGEFPLTAKGKKSEIECRPLARSLLEKHLKTPIQRADIAIGTYDAVKPSLTGSLGTGVIGDYLMSPAQSALEEMAGLVGWDDPRVGRRMERIDAIRQRIQVETSRQAQALRDKLPAPAQNAWPVADGALEVRPSALSCNPANAKQYKALIATSEVEAFAKKPCVLELEIHNRSGVPIQVDDFYDRIGPLGELRLISSTGAVYGLALFATKQNGKSQKLDMDNRPIFGPGETFTVLATPTGGASVAFEAPFVLRGEHSRRTTAKTKEWTVVAGGAAEVRMTSIACGPNAGAEYNANAPSFGRTSWEKPPACVVHAEIRRLGATPVKLGHFFRDINPIEHIGLFDPASFTPPKKGRVPGEDARGVWLRPFALLGPDKARPLERDVEIAQGATVEIALASGEEAPAIAADLDKLILAMDFDEKFSFLRVE